MAYDKVRMIVLVASLCITAALANNVIVGDIDFAFNRIIEKTNFKASPPIWFDDVHELRTYNGNNVDKIAMVQLSDKSEKPGGVARVINGGPGFTFVTVEFWSEHDINYAIVLWANLTMDYRDVYYVE